MTLAASLFRAELRAAVAEARTGERPLPPLGEASRSDAGGHRRQFATEAPYRSARRAESLPPEGEENAA